MQQCCLGFEEAISRTSRKERKGKERKGNECETAGPSGLDVLPSTECSGATIVTYYWECGSLYWSQNQVLSQRAVRNKGPTSVSSDLRPELTNVWTVVILWYQNVPHLNICDFTWDSPHFFSLKYRCGTLRHRTSKHWSSRRLAPEGTSALNWI